SPSESKAEWGDVDFGYALRQEFWGQGYMSEALTGLITFIFTTTAAQAIFGECEVANPASARVMQHARMQQVAHVSESDEATGKVIESLRFQIKKPDWQSLKPGQSHT
ncbi:MAG: GNAT family N-acetyltransferase, partial [Caldilineaceae bacterium]|nr:GNAT family N-acetyltransferase [Caldilineaceae bacterium]